MEQKEQKQIQKQQSSIEDLKLSLPFPLPEVGIVTVEGLPWPLIARGKVRDIFDLGNIIIIT